MSQVYDATVEGKIRMFRQSLASARAAGDTGMARAMRVELATLGVFETTEDTTTLETPDAGRPRRGRRPKPRCEHEMIAERCPLCNEETAV